jgi:hypothetical protein
MMQCSQWISLAVALLLLASVATAFAECAWVLWATQRISVNGGPYQRASQSLLGAYTSAKDCLAWLDKTAGGHPSDSRAWTQATLDRYLNDTKGEITHISWQCLPDTIDPRAPKGK